MSKYPSILAGQTITADLLSRMLPDTIAKSANEDRASTITLTNDGELLTSLEANARYHVIFYIHFAALDAAQIQTQWAVPANASGLRSALGPAWTLAGGGATSQASDGGYHRSGVHAYTTAIRYGTRNSATNQCVAIEESFLTTVDAGTLALQWAQAVSNATATRVGAGSTLHIRRIG